MSKLIKKDGKVVVSAIKAPSLGKSLVEIFDITGKNADFSKYTKQAENQRQFRGDWGVFKEMDDQNNKTDKNTVAE